MRRPFSVFAEHVHDAAKFHLAFDTECFGDKRFGTPKPQHLLGRDRNKRPGYRL